MMKRLYLTAAKFFPESHKKNTEQLLIYANYPVDVDIWLGKSVIGGLFLMLLVSAGFIFVEDRKIQMIMPLIGAALVIVYQIAIYAIIYFKAENRARAIEEALPPALQLMAANINSGMTPFQAMKAASREEFGILKEEIDRATAKSFGTESFSKALIEMSQRINSEPFQRVVNLFVRGMETGGHMARLLEETSLDLMENTALKREMITTTKSYTIFILFGVLIAAPLLYAISIHFTDMVTTMRSKIDLSEAGVVGGFLTGEIEITSSFIQKVAIVNLVFTSMLAGFLIAIIREGKVKYGLRYIIFMVPGTIISFFLIQQIISYFFGA